MSESTESLDRAGEPVGTQAAPLSEPAAADVHDDSAPEEHHTHDQYPFLAHHYDTPKHQFESGKLGIWIFLVTEVLFFAGLFCAYAIYRGMHPEIFYWAHYYLDTKLGALNTAVLIMSSLTAAWAVRNAQLGQQRMLVTNIAITIACALIFLGVKYVEYSHKFHDGLLWGGRPTADGVEPTYHFDPHHHVWELEDFEHKHPEAAAAARRLYAAAHPDETEPGEGAHGDAGSPHEPSSNGDAETAATGNTSPSSPAAPTATDAAPTASAAPSADASAAPSADASADASAAPSADASAAPSTATASSESGATGEEASQEPKPKVTRLESILSSLTEAEALPLLKAGVIGPHAVTPEVPSRPKNAHIFFGVYFFMTGLHGLHVLGGITVWIWLLTRAIRGQFGPQYFGPIDYAALYWHLVDLIWIYLFPLLYLIH